MIGVMNSTAGFNALLQNLPIEYTTKCDEDRGSCITWNLPSKELHCFRLFVTLGQYLGKTDLMHGFIEAESARLNERHAYKLSSPHLNSATKPLL